MKFNLLLLLALVFIVCAPVRAQQSESDKQPETTTIYRWTDENGSIHFSDSLHEVPADQREDATRIEAPKREQGSDSEESPSYKRPESDWYKTRELERKVRREKIKEKLFDLRDKLRELEDEISGLEEQLIKQRGTYQYIQMRQTEQKLSEKKSELVKVKKELNDLKAQGRQNGLTPGWFRENNFDGD